MLGGGGAPRPDELDESALALVHGAAVVPPGGGNGVEDVHGALVGWFGPLGICMGARPGTRDDAHGAAVPGPGAIPLLDLVPGSAMGSRKPGCGLIEGDAAVARGWLAVCTLAWICCATGSFSQVNSDPKGKCCTTGNLDSTSALYIFNMPCRAVLACNLRN